MIWALYGLIHSAMRAAFAETGRVLRIDPWKMAFWQALSGFVILLPFAAFITWPQDERFYLAAGGTALIVTVGTLIQMTLSAQRTGRVSGIYMPIEALSGFVLWLFIAPEPMETSLIALGFVALAFVLCSAALLRIRPHDIGRQTSMIILPAALTYAVAGVVTKMVVLPYGGVLELALGYTIVSFAVMTLVMGAIILLKSKTDELGERLLVRAGSITGVFSALGYTCFVAAVVHAPNPGYVSLLAMLLPVWLLGWHRYKKIEDTAKPGAALAIIAGVALLILAASL